jgi:hypothetical protein
MAGVGLAPCRSVVAENIRDLQRRAGHDRGLLCQRRVLLASVVLFARLPYEAVTAGRAGS